MKKGMTLKPRDLVLVIFDNIGFKVLGKYASYDQWTLIQIVVVQESKLIEDGFYQDDADPSERISREPDYNWAEECRATDRHCDL